MKLSCRWQKMLLLCAALTLGSLASWATSEVSIQSDKDVYSTTEPIFALILNNTNHTIVTLDEQSYCTIVTLEFRVGDHWEPIGPCPLERIAMPVRIKAGELKQVELPAEAFNSGLRKSGTYRLRFTFFNGENPDPTTTPIVIFSPTFRVVELPLGDTNGDGCVNDFDLTNVILDFGGKPDVHGNSDVNGDGMVDDFDLTLVITHFLEGCHK